MPSRREEPTSFPTWHLVNVVAPSILSLSSLALLLLLSLPIASAESQGPASMTAPQLDGDSISSNSTSILGKCARTLAATLSRLHPRTEQRSWDVWQIVPTTLVIAGIVPLWFLFKQARTVAQTHEAGVRDVQDKGRINRFSISPFKKLRDVGMYTPDAAVCCPDSLLAHSPICRQVGALTRVDCVLDLNKTEPGLLQKHSEFRSFSTPNHGFTYPSLRLFFRPHPQADKLPSTPSPLPLLVFIHGLGGSIVQFHPLLTSLVNLAPCLAIDLPGCGRSAFAPTSWDAYTTDALVELLGVVIDAYRDREAGQGYVLIGHSMGCSLAASLASQTLPASSHDKPLGLVAICPRGSSFTPKQTRLIQWLMYIPNFIFALWRVWDRRGGVESKSLTRFVGPKADLETRRLQMRINRQSRTAVLRRMISGWQPRSGSQGVGPRRFSNEEIWAGVDVPVYLVAGEDDTVTSPAELENIARYLGYGHSETSKGTAESRTVTDDLGSVTRSRNRGVSEQHGGQGAARNSSDQQEQPAHSEESRTPIRRALKTTVLPSPASHALMYSPATTRTLAGLLSDFLAAHIDRRLSLGWQLQYLSTEGKWDVKNLTKWQVVVPVSAPIGGVFRAMKTLREVDDRHRPEIFVREWAGRIRDVIDISHESPVYDPIGLEKGGIGYHKFPTASKIPPTADEVKAFIKLIDGLHGLESADDERPKQTRTPGPEDASTGVHCHYGYNRTGFFVVCYMVERLGYRLQDALDEFANKRAPGIRHEHFIDTLFVRYCIGLKRAPTL
ncbi:MAG: hypothetical protein M4579_004135 [Chaenotheca gracillima]|nr:MAG: hypothetical protein M4579_004135 [Chaenotheca gracillima]